MVGIPATSPTIVDVATILHSNVRLQILMVVRQGPVCVTELSDRVDLAKDHVMHELELFERNGAIRTVKRGRHRVCLLGPNLGFIPIPGGGLILRFAAENACAVAVELSPAAVAELERALKPASRNGHVETKSSKGHPSDIGRGDVGVTRRAPAPAPTDRARSYPHPPIARG